MAITNYVVKYSGAVDEKFSAESKSERCINKGYSFVGTKTVKVYNIATSKMNDYKRTGQNRYGDIQDLEVTEQEMTMKKDRSFTFAIDKMDQDETAGALQAATALARQLKEVVIPEVDAYRYTKMATSAGTKKQEALTKDNIYEAVTEATEKLDEENVPETGRFMIVTPATYKLMKQCKEIVLDTEIGQDMRLKGIIAMLDNTEIIKVPSKLLPENTNFIMGHNIACTAPVKLAEYKVNDEPQGISGALVEGRVYYDAFVLTNKAKALYAHNNA
ncbi:MAG: hypothetical protein ACTJGH_00395 [Peptoniphilaceae bacterium]